MVLTAAFEFDPRSNKEATIRPTDNIEVPQVMAASLERNLQIWMCRSASVCQENRDCQEIEGDFLFFNRRATTSPVSLAVDP